MFTALIQFMLVSSTLVILFYALKTVYLDYLEKQHLVRLHDAEAYADRVLQVRAINQAVNGSQDDDIIETHEELKQSYLKSV